MTDYVDARAIHYSLSFALDQSDTESTRSILDFDFKAVNHLGVNVKSF
jgi:hypothetical protein